MTEPEDPTHNSADGGADDDDGRTFAAEGWTASVHKNEDDDGWAVSMTRDGDAEPALVTPWVMGRDKKNPKPLDASSFRVLVKTANDVLTRHAAQARARLHKSVTVTTADGATVTVDLDVVPDDDDPHAVLSAVDDAGTQLASARVAPNYALTPKRARQWIESGYREP